MTFYFIHDLSFDVTFEKSLKMMMMTMKDKSKKRELDVLALKNGDLEQCVFKGSPENYTAEIASF